MKIVCSKRVPLQNRISYRRIPEFNLDLIHLMLQTSTPDQWSQLYTSKEHLSKMEEIF